MSETSVDTAMVRRITTLRENLNSPAESRFASRDFAALVRRHSMIAVCMLFIALGLGPSANAQNMITYDVPGAGTGPGQGTYPFGINPRGVAEGYFVDHYGVAHGFLREAHGRIITVDALGAGSEAGQGTFPQSINVAGAITGYYTDGNGLSHGFVRAPDGDFTTFDAPGAGFAQCSPPIICANGTQGGSINAAGAIAGQYGDTSGVFHGFLRSPDGTITTFDAPGAGTGPGQGTFVTFGDGINPLGAIACGYADTSNVTHSCVRSPDGTFTTFDPADSVFTDNAGIDAAGTVVSLYSDASGVYHGSVRAPSGTFTLVNISGAGTVAGQGTEPLSINAGGAITGVYVDGNCVNHGFLRSKDGRVDTFDIPGAGTAPGPCTLFGGQGTFPLANNPANAITGFYVDASGVAHGFLRTSPDE